MVQLGSVWTVQLYTAVQLCECVRACVRVSTRHTTLMVCVYTARCGSRRKQAGHRHR